jgi:cell division FtsZ-interacting protein ZapD
MSTMTTSTVHRLTTRQSRIDQLDNDVRRYQRQLDLAAANDREVKAKLATQQTTIGRLLSAVNERDARILEQDRLIASLRQRVISLLPSVHPIGR